MVALSALDSQWYWRGGWKNRAATSSRQERAKWFAFLLDSVLCLTARHPAGLIVESPGHGSAEYCSAGFSLPQSQLVVSMRRVSWRLALLFCLPLPLIACRDSQPICEPTPTQPCPGEAASLSGAVLDNGYPLFGVNVTLTGPGADQTDVTDATGGYSFSQLSPGDYTVSVSGQPGSCQDDGGFARQATVTEDGVATADVTLNCSRTWIAVAAGRASCGIRSTGRAYCWGRGGSGALGNGFSGDVPNPSAVASTSSFTQIEPYFDSACGLTGSGAFCWGANTNGGLGNGTTDDTDVPVQVQTGATFTQLGDGGCALDGSGTGVLLGLQ